MQDSRTLGVQLLESRRVRGAEASPVHEFLIHAPGIQQVLHAISAQPAITLAVRSAPLRMRGRTVLGAWDPLLWRIELFSVGPGRSDAAIVDTFLHELAHAYFTARDVPQHEPWAEALAQRWAALLSTSRVQSLAAELRARAVSPADKPACNRAADARDLGSSAGHWL